MNGWSSLAGSGGWDDEPAWLYEITWEWEPLAGQRYPGDPGRRRVVHTPVYEASRGAEPEDAPDQPTSPAAGPVPPGPAVYSGPRGMPRRPDAQPYPEAQPYPGAQPYPEAQPYPGAPPPPAGPPGYPGPPRQAPRPGYDSGARPQPGYDPRPGPDARPGYDAGPSGARPGYDLAGRGYEQGQRPGPERARPAGPPAQARPEPSWNQPVPLPERLSESRAVRRGAPAPDATQPLPDTRPGRAPTRSDGPPYAPQPRGQSEHVQSEHVQPEYPGPYAPPRPVPDAPISPSHPQTHYLPRRNPSDGRPAGPPPVQRPGSSAPQQGPRPGSSAPQQGPRPGSSAPQQGPSAPQSGPGFAPPAVPRPMPSGPAPEFRIAPAAQGAPEPFFRQQPPAPADLHARPVSPPHPQRDVRPDPRDVAPGSLPAQASVPPGFSGPPAPTSAPPPGRRSIPADLEDTGVTSFGSASSYRDGRVSRPDLEDTGITTFGPMPSDLEDTGVTLRRSDLEDTGVTPLPADTGVMPVSYYGRRRRADGSDEPGYELYRDALPPGDSYRPRSVPAAPGRSEVPAGDDPYRFTWEPVRRNPTADEYLAQPMSDPPIVPVTAPPVGPDDTQIVSPAAPAADLSTMDPRIEPAAPAAPFTVPRVPVQPAGTPDTAAVDREQSPDEPVTAPPAPMWTTGTEPVTAPPATDVSDEEPDWFGDEPLDEEADEPAPPLVDVTWQSIWSEAGEVEGEIVTGEIVDDEPLGDDVIRAEIIVMEPIPDETELPATGTGVTPMPGGPAMIEAPDLERPEATDLERPEAPDLERPEAPDLERPEAADLERPEAATEDIDAAEEAEVVEPTVDLENRIPPPPPNPEAAAAPSDQDGDDGVEEHGLGWLLTQSGLGANTIPPESDDDAAGTEPEPDDIPVEATPEPVDAGTSEQPEETPEPARTDWFDNEAAADEAPAEEAPAPVDGEAPVESEAPVEEGAAAAAKTTESARQPGDQRGEHERRLVDPELVLASYPWHLDPTTLRELNDDPDQLLTVRDRLTDKVEYAERDSVRARLLSLRAVVERILGDLDAAEADGRAALGHAEATGELRRIAIAQARLAHVLQWRGEFAEADKLYAEADSVELPGRLRAEIRELAGRSAYEQGRHTEAMNQFEIALDLRKGHDPELTTRIETALDAILAKVGAGEWGPYPRTEDEIRGRRRPPEPARDERTGLWGYPGLTRPAFADAQPFRDGMAWVRRPGVAAWELVSEQGKVLIDASGGYLGASPFADGLAWVSREGAGGWFAIDARNRVIIPGAFDDVRPFHRGVAPIRRGGWGAIDRHGRFVVQPKYRAFATVLAGGRRVDGFTDEGLAVVDAGDRLGVIDRTGQLLVAPTHAALAIHPVAYLIGDRQGRWGALDRNGDPLIDVVHRNETDVTDEIDRLLADTRPIL